VAALGFRHTFKVA